MNGRCGFVAIVGAPNAGKSTLVNALAGEKTSIVSRRRQTTRGVVRAVCQRGESQLILLDSPGWQAGRASGFSKRLNGGAQWAAAQADLVLFMTTPRRIAEDCHLLASLPPAPPVAAAVNKIDLVKNKRTLLPVAEELSKLRDFIFIAPLSAKSGEGVERLAGELAAHLPESPALFDGGAPEDQDFFFGELLREKLFRALNDELPYRIAVLAQRREGGGRGALHVDAEIYVERESQKAVVIGGGGAMLKKLASAARREMERAAKRKIFLSTRVIVRPKWRQDARLLSKMRIGAPEIT